MEPPRAGRPGRPFGVSKPSDCKVLVVSSWSEPAGDRAAIMASEGESLPLGQSRCPIISKNKKRANKTEKYNLPETDDFSRNPTRIQVTKSVDQDAKSYLKARYAGMPIHQLGSLQSLSCPSTSPPTLDGKPQIRRPLRKPVG